MGFHRNNSLENLEREINQTFEKIYHNGKSGVNDLWLNLCVMREYFKYNFNYLVHLINNRMNKENERENKENDYKYRVRHNLLINELKNRQIDVEWETINRV